MANEEKIEMSNHMDIYPDEVKNFSNETDGSGFHIPSRSIPNRPGMIEISNGKGGTEWIYLNEYLGVYIDLGE